MKKVIKFMSLCIVATLMLVMTTTTALANDATNYGVSPNPRYLHSGISTDGASKPKEVWNIAESGQYDFKGSSNTVTIYTNYKFCGKTAYTIHVKNSGSYLLNVKAKTGTKTYSSTQIGAGKSADIEFSGIKDTTKFYIVFSGSKFSGYIN